MHDARLPMLELAYTSAARRPFDLYELGKLLERARLNNARAEISGILLYEAGSFIQVLEGERAAVQTLFDKIAADPRHERLHILQQRAIEQRSFAQWSMGFVTLDPQIQRDFPRRHGLSSNGSLRVEGSDLESLLEAFRNGRFRSYISG